MEKNKKRNVSGYSEKLRKIIVIALFCAIAYIFTYFPKFKVMFLTFDIKDAVMTIGAMYFGPLSAVIMTTIVSLIEFLTVSDTGVYGLIMNFIASTTFCLTASLIYKYNKKLLGAVMSLISAALAMTAVMMLANLFITPYYMGVTKAEVQSMIPTLFFPFNLSKGVLNAAVVMLLYKPLSNVLKRANVFSGKTEEKSPAKAYKLSSSIIAAVISLIIIVGTLLFLFLFLHAQLA